VFAHCPKREKETSTLGGDLDMNALLHSSRKTLAILLAFVMILTLFPAALATDTVAPIGGSAETFPFPDVPEGHWAREDIWEAYRREFVRGHDTGHYAPEGPVQRAEAVAILWNMEGRPAAAFQPNRFTDVSEGDWFAAAVMWAAERGVVAGRANNDGTYRFDPSTAITREELFAVKKNFAGAIWNVDLTSGEGPRWPFADHAQISPWAVDHIAWAHYVGLVVGINSGTAEAPIWNVNPLGTATRAELATLAVRFDDTDWLLAPGPFEGATIDILTFADFHGMVDSEIISMNDADPGAARFVAYAQYLRGENENPDNVMVIPGGDDLHGHPLSNFLLGAPGVAMMYELGVEYAALGNHEFSFGFERAMELTDEITYLAADLFYAADHPNTALRGTRPDWVEPYAVVEFEDGNITLALVGLMTRNMAGLVPAVFGEDSFYELRTPTRADADPAWITAIEDLIDELRDEYGVDAVIGVTHMYVSQAGGTITGGEAPRLAELIDGFDAIIGGHSHTRSTGVLHDTPIIEAGQHGRSMGRISLDFNADGDLDDVTLWLSPVNAIRDMELPVDPADPIRAAHDRMAAVIDAYWDAPIGGVTPRDHLLTPIGTRSIYSETRADRDVWATRLVLDYVIENAEVLGGANPTYADWVYVSNAGGWRNVQPFAFGPGTEVNRGHMYGTMPFNNAIILLEMHGRDLVTLLSMQGSGVATGPGFGLGGATGPLGGAVIAGAARGARLPDEVINGVSRPRWEWINTSTGDPISDDLATVYRVIGSNFILGGGDRFPFPGNQWGDLLQMTPVPDSVPLALMADGSTVPWSGFVAEFPDGTTWDAAGLRTLRTAMIAQQEWRGSNPGYTAELTVAATAGGTAEITSPFAPDDRVRNVNVVPQHVLVTATPADGYEFLGWFNASDAVDAAPLSTDLMYLFVQRGAQNLVARFSEVPAITATFLGIGDYHGFLNSENSASDPGAARFVSFMDARIEAYYETTGFEPIVLLAGDNYFGQSFSNLFGGESALHVLNRVGARYAALGNHEFSWMNRTLLESFGETNVAARMAMLGGSHPLLPGVPREPGIPYLAADVFLAGTDNRPAWVQPYAIETFERDGVSVQVAIVGLTYQHMTSLTNPNLRADLAFRTPRVEGGVDMDFVWFETLINGLRSASHPSGGVDAVIAITHTSWGASSDNVVNGLVRRGNAHLDGWFSGHTHGYQSTVRANDAGDEQTIRTAMVNSGHHGRGIGQIQLMFNQDGDLMDVSATVHGASNGNLVRGYDPDQEILEWIYGAGATWTRNGLDLIVTPGPGNDGLHQIRNAEWGETLGARSTYNRDRNGRNQWLLNLVVDYVNRVHADDVPATAGVSSFDGTIAVMNDNAWRQEDPEWVPSDVVTYAELVRSYTFLDSVPLFEMRGADLIELLNIPSGGNHANPGRDPGTGLPNWGTIGGKTIAGAYLQDDVWHNAATGLPISNTGVYRMAVSSHMFNGVGANGGQRFPLPGNNHGAALGFEQIGFVSGLGAYNEGRYDFGPQFAARDPISGQHLSIREVWAREVQYRATLAASDFTSWVAVEAGGGDGTARLEVWGNGVVATAQSRWGNPSYGTTANTQRDLLVNGHAVRVTATPGAGFAFVGWFDADDPLGPPRSLEPVYIFTTSGTLTLEARFASVA